MPSRISLFSLYTVNLICTVHDMYMIFAQIALLKEEDQGQNVTNNLKLTHNLY